MNHRFARLTLVCFVATVSLPVAMSAESRRNIPGNVEIIVNGTDAGKLVTIVRDWAKHTDDEWTSNVLRTVLANCLPDMDAEALRRVLSAFLLSLPEPWQSQAASVLTTATQPPKSTERSWRSFLPFP
jgi:hypothetical protein